MTIREANQKLLFQLYHDYDNREAANIADLLMENLSGWKKIDRVVNSNVRLSAIQESLLQKFTDEIQLHKPVQYIINEAWFGGMKFYVDENVLIPRPETEELVHWIVSENKNNHHSVLDIGTGSGCIAISLKKNIGLLNVTACDISDTALSVAKKNAATHQVVIDFINVDILDKSSWENFPRLDIIVSNPPYIPLQEKNSMNKNVVLHEPGIALFVPDNDPLMFYRGIIHFAEEKLISGGQIFLEIHEDLAEQTASLFKKEGYKNVEIKKDMQGKDRMLRAY